jgi:RNA polymerase sigma-70 factor (ECF subfamily)
VLRRSRSSTRPSRDGTTDTRLRDLVNEHTDAIYRVAVSVVRDSALAEDVVQETIIKAWRSLDTYRGEGSERSWMLQIAHNTAVSALRRVRDEATDPGELPDRPELRDPERHATGRDDLDRIARILDSLDELSRSILVLRDVEGMTYQQIATTLDIPIPTVKTRLLRARRELQRLAQVGDLA